MLYELRDELGRRAHGRVVTIPIGVGAGLKWWCDRRYDFGFALGLYDYCLLQCLSELARPGAVFYDLGACAGYYSVLLTSRLGGRAYAFEPCEDNRKVIARQLRLNRIDSVEIVPKCVTSRSGVVDFHLHESREWRSLIRDPRMEDRFLGKRKVAGVSLDDFCATHPRPDLLKIDIQGAAHLALEGFAKTMRSHRPLFLIELHDEAEIAGVKARLKDWGYTWFFPAENEAEEVLLAVPRDEALEKKARRALSRFAAISSQEWKRMSESFKSPFSRSEERGRPRRSTR
jgi:FkbM family methyltransferase